MRIAHRTLFQIRQQCGDQRPAAFAATRALQGIGAGFIWPCTLAFGATKVGGPEHRGLVMGMILAALSVELVLGAFGLEKWAAATTGFFS